MVLFGMLALVGGAFATATSPVAYDSILSPLPPNVPSQPFQAQQTAEFGDDIQLAGSNHYISSVTVTMSDWAKHSDWVGTYPSSAGFDYPLTLNIYNVDTTGADPALGSLITTTTQTKTIPWRPEHDASCAGDAWLASDASCYNGLAFNVTFTFPHAIYAPSRVIVGIAYNTESWGANPIGVDGPYDSLNVGLNNVTGPSVGTDSEPNAVFWNTETASWYTDGGAGGVGTFRRDTNWAPYVPMFQVDTEAGCTTTCYVDAANGSDSYSGSSAADAKKTIQAGIDSVSAGGTVRVLPGNYDETATNRGTTTDTGSYQFGLFFPPSKPGITLQGVTAGDVAITNVANVATTVTTNATNDFGYSGVYVSADNITIRGMGFGQNTPYSDSKTIEVIGDNFTFDASKITSDASLYIGDGDPRYDNHGTPANFADDTSYIKTYTVTGNTFAGDSSLYIANGAGFSGPTSGRVITDNTFTNTEPVSFAGPGAEGWLVYPVGAAVFTGNTFTDATATRYVQAWGDQAPAPFDWSDVFTLNTYPHPVVTTTDGNLDHLRPYTAGAFTDIYRVGAVIQNRVDNSQAGDTVIAGAGTFDESVTISDSITLRGAQAGVDARGRSANETIIESTSGGTGGSALKVAADNVAIDGVEIKGVGATGDQRFGIDLTSGADRANLHITNSIFLDLYEGIHRPSFSVDGLTVDKNVFTNDGGNVLAQDAGLWLAGSGSASNVAITNNAFSNMDNDPDGDFAAINLNGGTTADIHGNSSNHDGTFIVLVDYSGATIGTNVTNNESGSTIFLGMGNDGVTISGNTLQNGFRGVRLSTAFGGTTKSSAIEVTGNTISGMVDAGVFVDTGTVSDSVAVNQNAIAGNGDGVRNSSDQSVDASCNWWGSASGPSGTGPGTGDTVSIGATFVPWLTTDQLDVDCAAVSVHGGGAADVTGNEGSVQSTTGSFDGSIASYSLGAGEPGTLVDNGGGSWTWSYTPADNFGPTTIDVTGHGTNGTTATDSFNASATNVAPTATFTAPASALYSTSFGISLTSPSDPSSTDTTAGFTYAFDCGSGYSLASTTTSATCNLPADSGTVTVKGRIFDKDSGFTEYTASVQITQPKVQLTPTAHNYGTQLINTTSASTTYTVQNIGSSDLAIGSVDLAGTNPGHFGIDTNNCDTAVLHANDTCTILVFFRPTTSGSKTARLEVNSNDPDSATAISNLSGTGGVASNGTITVNLDARPDGPQSFAFTGTNGIGSFNLTDNGTSANTASFSAAAGDYVVKMTQVDGWSLQSLTCTANETINKTKGKVTIHLAAGQNVSCTYTQTQRVPDGSIALSSGGPYVGVGVYSNAAQPSQTQNQAIAKGHTFSFYAQLTNNGLDSDTFNVYSTLSGSTKFKVRFFVGSTDVTARVNAGTYNVTLAAGSQVTLQIRVTTKSGTKVSATRNIDVTMKSKSSTSKDVVRAHVTRA